MVKISREVGGTRRRNRGNPKEHFGTLHLPTTHRHVPSDHTHFVGGAGSTRRISRGNTGYPVRVHRFDMPPYNRLVQAVAHYPDKYLALLRQVFEDLWNSVSLVRLGTRSNASRKIIEWFGLQNSHVSHASTETIGMSFLAHLFSATPDGRRYPQEHYQRIFDRRTFSDLRLDNLLRTMRSHFS